jgi:hypothetical protein
MLKIYLDLQKKTKLNLKELLEAQVCKSNKALSKISIKISSGSQVTLIDDIFSFGTFDYEFILDNKVNFVYLCNIFSKDNDKLSKRDSAPDILSKKIKVKLIGQDSCAKCFYRILGTGCENYNIKTCQEHWAQKTESFFEIKGVVQDSSKIICDSEIKISIEAKESIANQVCKGLILTKNGHFIATPKFQVETNETSCVHGAAISTVDSEQIFYCQSRGINYSDSYELLVNSFLSNSIFKEPQAL